MKASILLILASVVLLFIADCLLTHEDNHPSDPDD